jgi:succinate dehydrogenase hydrophobic anchor subunit
MPDQQRHWAQLKHATSNLISLVHIGFLHLLYMLHTTRTCCLAETPLVPALHAQFGVVLSSFVLSATCHHSTNGLQLDTLDYSWYIFYQHAINAVQTFYHAFSAPGKRRKGTMYCRRLL